MTLGQLVIGSRRFEESSEKSGTDYLAARRGTPKLSPEFTLLRRGPSGETCCKPTNELFVFLKRKRIILTQLKDYQLFKHN
jgi:hypothetical protein